MVELTQWQLVGVAIGSVMVWHILLWFADRIDEAKVLRIFSSVNANLDVFEIVGVQIERHEVFDIKVRDRDGKISTMLRCDRSMINDRYVREFGEYLAGLEQSRKEIKPAS